MACHFNFYLQVHLRKVLRETGLLQVTMIESELKVFTGF